jgi:hypothetical protein
VDLFGKKVISTQERDTNVAAAESSKASVAADEAAVEQADLNLRYTKIIAPIDGYVTKEAVAIGDYVQVGQAVMSLVPPRVWVVANFKETQRRNMQPGQPVDISVDAYPSLKLRGHVDRIQAGSGAAFSLLPPENATGNYVKVGHALHLLWAAPLPPGQQLQIACFFTTRLATPCPPSPVKTTGPATSQEQSCLAGSQCITTSYIYWAGSTSM